MKKVLSLLLSITLFVTMNLNIITASAAGTTMIEKTNVVIDMSEVDSFVMVTGNYSDSKAMSINNVKQQWMYIPRHVVGSTAFTITPDTETFGFNVMKMVYSGGYAQLMLDGYVQSGQGASAANIFCKKAIYEGRVYQTADGKPNWKKYPEAVDVVLSESIYKNTWYNFSITVDTVNDKLTLSYIEDLDDSDIAAGVEPHSVINTHSYTRDDFSSFRYHPGVPGGETVYIENLKISWEEMPYEKAEILSIGTDGVVEDGQNIIPVTLSADIPGISKEYVMVTENGKDENLVSDIEITSDGTNPVLNIICKQNLPNWFDFTLTIDPLAFGDGAYQVTNGESEDVSIIIADFKTKKPDFGMKEPEFTYTNGMLNAKALVINTSGTPEDTSFVYSSFTSDGMPAGIYSKTNEGFDNTDGEYLEYEIPSTEGNIYNFFVINGWESRKPLFGKAYRLNAEGDFVSAPAVDSCEPLPGSEAAIALSDFDYENIAVTVMADTKEGKMSDGILYIYKAGEVLSDTNHPLYAEYVSTANDGTFTKKISFGEKFGYGEYTVEYYPIGANAPLTKSFNYYTPDELVELRKEGFVTSAKACTSADELKELILGVDSSGTPINDNFDFICETADVSLYEALKNPDSAFEKMLESVSSLTNYASFINLFEASSLTSRNAEIEAQRLVIYSDASSSQTHASLRLVILGLDEKGETANDNFDIVSNDADMTYYNIVRGKDKVFAKMHPRLSAAYDYNSLIDLFESCAIMQYKEENTSSSGGGGGGGSVSSNNKGYGGSSVAIKETVSTPVVSDPTDPDNSQTNTPSSGIFSDMRSHWAESYVNELSKRGIMNGYTDGSFRGENSITRAELTKTIVEALNISPGTNAGFTDVPADSWYAQYVAGAIAAGIVNGYEDGSFAPDREITRQDAALMLYRAMKIGRDLLLGYTFFNDDLEIDDYASGAIRTLGELGIVNGDSNKEFNPKQSITRAEVATIICRALDYIESH